MVGHTRQVSVTSELVALFLERLFVKRKPIVPLTRTLLVRFHLFNDSDLTMSMDNRQYCCPFPYKHAGDAPDDMQLSPEF